MQLKNLFTDDRAVSPVIGVILMVAITVILAAVIGTFVLGLGDSLQDTSPQASFGFDYGDTPADGVTVTHEGGDSIDNTLLDINVDGTEVEFNGSQEHPWTSEVRSGSSVTVTNDSSDAVHSNQFDSTWGGESIRVIWTSDDGSNSQTIGSSTTPSN